MGEKYIYKYISMNYVMELIMTIRYTDPTARISCRWDATKKRWMVISDVEVWL